MSGITGKNTDRSSGIIGTSEAGMASLAADSSPQLGGFLDAAGNYIQMEKGGDISSASPTVIDTDGDFFACTGTTNFSAFTVAADRHFFLEFGGALTMTHGNGTLDLPGAANITTAASDVGEFVSTAANVVTCVNYTKRDGTAVVAVGGASEVVQGTFDYSTSTGTFSITGAGFTPTVCIILGSDSANAASIGYTSSATAADNASVYNDHLTASDEWTVQDDRCASFIGGAGGAGQFIDLNSFDADGATFANTKAGSPTGTIRIKYLFMK